MSKKPNFETLLTAICAGHGYCGSLQPGGFVHVTDFIPDRGMVSAEQFVEWVFLADGVHPSDSLMAMKHRETLRQCFIDHMAATVVDARRLRWSRR